MTHQPTIHTTMHELLARWPSTRGLLVGHGMACLGCPMARFDTLGEAAAEYGLDPRELLSEVQRRATRRTARRARPVSSTRSTACLPTRK